MKQSQFRIKWLSIILAGIFIIGMLPLHAKAEESIDVGRKSSIEIVFEYEGQEMSGVTFSVYKVADISSDATLTLNSTFSKYPVTFDGTSEEEWDTLATTLKGFVVADQIDADASIITGENGRVELSDLSTGLYLVIGQKILRNGYTYTFQPSMITTPTWDEENSEWYYDIVILPKTTRVKVPESPEVEIISRSVMKVWNTNIDANDLPDFIEVNLYKDNVLYDTVKLNREINWRYTWDRLPEFAADGSKIEWTAVEKDSVGFTVRVQQAGVTTLITNTKVMPTTPPDQPPAIPDTGLLWWPVPILAFTGITLLVIGIVRNKSQRQ